MDSFATNVHQNLDDDKVYGRLACLFCLKLVDSAENIADNHHEHEKGRRKKITKFNTRSLVVFRK